MAECKPTRYRTLAARGIREGDRVFAKIGGRAKWHRVIAVDTLRRGAVVEVVNAHGERLYFHATKSVTVDRPSAERPENVAPAAWGVR